MQKQADWSMKKIDQAIENAGIRMGILLALHSALFAGLLWMAMLLRFEFEIPQRMLGNYINAVALIVAAKVLVFYLVGHFHGWYRYVTFSDLLALCKASAMAAIVVAAVNESSLFDRLPRSVMLLDLLLTVVATGALRSSWRLYDERTFLLAPTSDIENALMVGVRAQDGKLAHLINSQRESGIRVKGLVALGNYPNGARFGTLRFLGSIDRIHSLSQKHNCSLVLVTSNALNGVELRELISTCNEHNLRVRILPQLDEVLQGADHIPLRELNIDDLLRRAPAKLDSDRIEKTVTGKRVLVTGAGGSIGSEICRQLIQFRPSEIVLLGRGENRIFSIARELKQTTDQTKLTPVIADVTNEVSMRQCFSNYQPELVFHAAAHKHVHLMEHHVIDAVINNAQGTRVTANLAIEFGVERFVLISTDKAVNPTSVMGCSKQLAERVIQARANTSDTVFGVVRFGNVLGSNGSVIPIFQEQIRKGGPITVTDPSMTRFFMSIPEASQLVLQAGSMCSGGEVFCLDMGEPIKIVDLAKDLIRLSGLPENSIEIEFIGARTGEKLYEELYFDEEATIKTEHEKVRAAHQRPYEGVHIDTALDSMIEMQGSATNEELKDHLKELIPEYQRPASLEQPKVSLSVHTQTVGVPSVSHEVKKQPVHADH